MIVRGLKIQQGGTLYQPYLKMPNIISSFCWIPSAMELIYGCDVRALGIFTVAPVMQLQVLSAVVGTIRFYRMLNKI